MQLLPHLVPLSSVYYAIPPNYRHPYCLAYDSQMGLGKTVELLACILAHPRGEGDGMGGDADDSDGDSDGGESDGGEGMDGGSGGGGGGIGGRVGAVVGI